MQKEEDYRREHFDSGVGDLDFVVSVIFLAIKIEPNLHGSFYEFLDCESGENTRVGHHKLFIRQDVVDVEQLVADALHREATDEGDGPYREKIERRF